MSHTIPPPTSTGAAASTAFAHAPPAEAALIGALTLLHVHELGGNNRGEMVESMLHDVGTSSGAPWCAAYVRRAGHYALLDPITGHSRWPLPDTASCQTLAAFARDRDILAAVPVRGDLFLLWNEARAGFHHTGFVWSVTITPDGYRCTTLEGNTNPGGTSDDGVCLRIRTFPFHGTTRFIAWPRLVPAERAA